MGDRGNIGIKHPYQETPIYFYTHWEGHRIAQILAEGLKVATNEGRLEDFTYATRIIFDTLTGLKGGSTGYGISIGYPCDNQYDIPTVIWTDEGAVIIEYKDMKHTAEKFIDFYTPVVAS